APTWRSRGTSRPPADTTIARWPACTRASAISRVERSTPPDSRAGSSWTTVSGGGTGAAAAGSVDQDEVRPAVRAVGLAALGLDRQVHPRMRVPQRHRRQRAAQRQVRAAHLVLALGVGWQGLGLGGGHVGTGYG